MVTTVRDYIPRGNTLEPEAFQQRHLLLCWILGLHVPALLLFGLWRGVGFDHAGLAVLTPMVLLLCARLTPHRRTAAFFVTAGLVFCSSVLVHLSEGSIEAHFHFFILIGLIALYQDWVPFLWNAGFTVLSHGVGGVLTPEAMYNHHAAQAQPWTWALIHGVAVLAACVGVIIFWKNTEIEQRRSMMLAARLASAETEAAQRQTVSDLFINLARRNQSLLDRQLELIAELESSERTPEALAELFQLDHLATRIRRNAESLLVLSGDDPARRWGRPVLLGEVVRAAAAEVEDYQRVDILVSEHLEIAGHAVADLAHLLAELIENATSYSPATTDVRVRSYLTPGLQPTTLLSIEDMGIGMTEADRLAANELLGEPPDIDLRGRTMGFHVVSRLARRYGLDVSLAHTPGGGVTALVMVPDSLVGEHRPEVPEAPGDFVITGRRSATSHDVPGPTATPSATPASPSPRRPAHVQLVPPVELTSEGLARRVPGAGLSPSLRRSAPTSTAVGDVVHPVRGPRTVPGDREQMRSMLSRFQASQRAGRAVADAPVGSLAPTSLKEESRDE